MMHYSFEHWNQILAKGYWFLSFARNERKNMKLYNIKIRKNMKI